MFLFVGQRRPAALARLGAFAVLSGAALLLSGGAARAQTQVFFTDFNLGTPPQMSGVITTTGVQGYAGMGPAGNQFGGNMLHNSTGGPFGQPGSLTTLTLTGLPVHTSVDIDFLLAIIDSWDGTSGVASPDFFNVRVDNVTVFSHTFDHINLPDQTYTGASLTYGSNVGFNPVYFDAAYDLTGDAALSNIAHTSSTLTVDFFASGGGWQGGIDESWGMDNLKVTVNGTIVPGAVPEFGTVASLGGLLALGGLGMVRRRRSA